MPLRRAPDLPLGPQGEFSEFSHSGMVSGHTVDYRQVTGIKDPSLDAEPGEEALGLQRQEPAVGALPKRAVEQQDERRVRARAGMPSRVRSGISNCACETLGSERSREFTSGIQFFSQVASAGDVVANASWISCTAFRAARVTPASVAEATRSSRHSRPAKARGRRRRGPLAPRCGQPGSELRMHPSAPGPSGSQYTR